MGSSFTWLDYSEREQRRMLDVIGMFQEKETRDELGIGVVRDAFADMLFPGTSTIQTRARYFLFVPWIYRDLERRKARTAEISAEARKREVRLIDALLDAGETEGVIGRFARSNLKRLPSSVYWQGLGIWGIRSFPGSQEQYHGSLDAFYEQQRRTQRTDDGDPVEDAVRNWHAGLPPAPADLLEGASFELGRGEAEYLRERIMANVPDSLLAFLVDRDHGAASPTFPWLHPRFGDLPSALQAQLRHARNFSETIHGASLLYNLMLADARGLGEFKEFYRDELAAWASDLEGLSRELADWDRDEFWETVASEGARVARPARAFVDAWLDLALVPGRAAGIADDEDARRLIREREIGLKRGLARLQNQSALELWGGAAGAYQIGYRWSDARVIIRDIREGLTREDEDA